jgi:hypothetical protein
VIRIVRLLERGKRAGIGVGGVRRDQGCLGRR